MAPKLISQGAEAKIYLTTNLDTHKLSDSSKGEQLSNPNINEQSSTILKQRIKKSYRHSQLDNQIRTRRTKSEAKILTKALEAEIQVPKVLDSDKFNLQIEYIDGDRLSETLNKYNEDKQFKIMKALGHQVALLHENNLIHGDLTTSNTIWKGDKVYIIDLGLGFVSTKQEDKAVDLHLIKQALEAKHFQNHEDLFREFKKGYKWKISKQIIKRLEVVERRGRYKH